MAMTWMFLLVVFIALGMFAVVIGVMVMLFRAASKSSARPTGDSAGSAVPPIITDDSLTNPANPLYHTHHPTPMPDNASHHHSIGPGPSPSTFDASPSQSFDSASSPPPSCDTGGSGCG